MQAFVKTTLFLFALFLITAIYTIAWSYFSYTVKSKLETFAQVYSEKGINIKFDPGKSEGFPFSLTLPLNGLEVTSNQHGFKWTAPERVALHYSIMEPRTLQAFISGQHIVTGINENRPKGTVVIDANVEKLAADFDFDLKLKGMDIQSSSLDLRSDTGENFGLGDLLFQVKTDPGGDVTFTSSIEKIILPRTMRSFSNILVFAAAGVVESGIPVSFKPLDMRAWHEKNGVLKLENFLIRADPMIFESQGTIRLDDNLNIKAEGTSYIKNFTAMVKNLENSGVLEKDQIRLINIAALLFRKKARDNDGHELVIPLSIENQVVRVGNFVIPIPKNLQHLLKTGPEPG